MYLSGKKKSHFITSQFVCIITVQLTARYAKAAITKELKNKIRSLITADFIVWVISIFPH